MKRFFYTTFAFIVLSVACNSNNKIELVNDVASLPSSFNFQQSGLKVMASFINKKSGTMSVLYADSIALKNAIAGKKELMAGELMELITWKQQDDDHWFGAKIPGALQSAETLEIKSTPAGLLPTYQKYSGKNLHAERDTLGQAERIKFILDQQPSVMP